MSWSLCRAIVCVGLCAAWLIPSEGLADAIIQTRAMKASTIMEVFVDEELLRVVLEVGTDDYFAFRNMLPEEIYARLANVDHDAQDRSQTFLNEDWGIVADDQRLVGTIESCLIAKRLVRDEITGQALPRQPDDVEEVVRAELHYPLRRRPATLVLAPPVATQSSIAANIGFVVYHRGVAVNDFRYMSRAETLHLDWEDPWYSRFESKNLLRRYTEPAAAFLYVENFEVRKEILFRPKDLQRWTDLGLAGVRMIPSQQRAEICNRAATFLDEHSPVTIDGQAVAGTLDRVHFVQRTLRTSGVVEPGRDIDMHTAMLGVIVVYPINELPQRVEMAWDLFDDRVQRVPTVAHDEAGGLPGNLEPTDTHLVWQNYLLHPTVPSFAEVPPPPRRPRLTLPVISLLCFVGAGLVWFGTKVPWGRLHMPTTARVLACVLLLVIAAGTARTGRVDVPIPTAPAPQVSDGEVHLIAVGLLRNLYASFGYRDENLVYEVLNRSVSGELLTSIYVQTQRSLTLASQGGARVKVKDVELLECTVTPTSDHTCVDARCTWVVAGSVGHWGHIHERRNQYRADLKFQVMEGGWKITSMDVISEERL